MCFSCLNLSHKTNQCIKQNTKYLLPTNWLIDTEYLIWNTWYLILDVTNSTPKPTNLSSLILGSSRSVSGLFSLKPEFGRDWLSDPEEFSGSSSSSEGRCGWSRDRWPEPETCWRVLRIWVRYFNHRAGFWLMLLLNNLLKHNFKVSEQKWKPDYIIT